MINLYRYPYKPKFLELINKLFIFLAMVGSNAILFLDIPLYLYYRFFFLIFLFIILNIFFLKKNIILRASRILKRNIIFLIFFATFSFMSILWAPSKELAIRYSILLFSQVTLTVLVIFITRENIINYINFLIKIFVFSVIIAYFQIFDILNFEIAYSYEFKNIGAFSVYGFNEFAYIITIFYPLLITYIFLKNRILALIITFLTLISLFFTGSILGFLSVLLESFLLIFLTIKRKSNKDMKILAFFIVLILLLGVFSIEHILDLLNRYYITTSVISQFQTQLQFSNQTGDLFSYRLVLSKFAFELIVKSYFLGVGAGGDSFYIINAGLPGNTHNWLLEVITNFGIIIFSFYIIFLLEVLYKLKSIFNNLNLPYEIRSIALGLLLGLGILPINGMIVSSLIKLNAFWIYYGIIVAFCDRYSHVSGGITS